MDSVRRGRGVVTLVVVLAVVVPATPTARAQPGPTDPQPPPGYAWPVSDRPVEGFTSPAGPYGTGHRGVDLPVAPGQPVHPMADGWVAWSGVVAGAPWTTVAHAHGIVSSYGPLQAPTQAPPGTAVTPADVLGRARGDAHGSAGRLHVGARRHGRYVDPAALVGDGRPLVATLVGPGTVEADAPAWPDRHPTLVPGTSPSPNHLVVLAGLTSHTGGQPFDLAGLGYGDGSWQQFSYLGVDEDGTPLAYDHTATWGRVHDMAVVLRDQLRARAVDHPGQAVDLLGHSLGGLVGMYYLLVLHDPVDPTLPPIGRVATVASPLGGADSANAVAVARSTAVGRALLDLVEVHLLTPGGADGPVMHDRMPVLDDLGTGSEVVAAVAEAWQRHLDDPWASPLATGTDVLTVGSTVDPVVNEHRSGLPGTDHQTILDPDLGTHSGVTRDARTEQLVLAHLAGEPLPDGGPGQQLANATAGLGSSVVAAFEYAIAWGTTTLDGMVPTVP